MNHQKQKKHPIHQKHPILPKRRRQMHPKQKKDDSQPKDDAQSKDDEKNEAPKNDEDAKQDDAKKADEESTAIDFSGTWVLKTSSKSIDEYYQSEGWGYVMRKMAPFVPIKQIIAQKGNELTVTMIVGPGGKFANETTVHYIDSDKETGTKDKDGPMQNVTKWNKDKTQLLTDIYRTNNKEHTYKQVRALSVLSDEKMIETITNCHGKELVRNYEKAA
eukprot:320340_1